MAPIEVFRYADPTSGNIIIYDFDPEIRDEEGRGVVSLAKSSHTPDSIAESPLSPAPKQGQEFYSYEAEDGADVRYQYDEGSRNGKDYVVAVHRVPENWTRLVEENLGVKGHDAEAKRKENEERMDEARRRGQEEANAERERRKRESSEEKLERMMSVEPEQISSEDKNQEGMGGMDPGLTNGDIPEDTKPIKRTDSGMSMDREL
jgi:hypothetical protein